MIDDMVCDFLCASSFPFAREAAVGFVEIVMLLIASVGGLCGLCSCGPVNTVRLGSVVGNWCKISPTIANNLSGTVAVRCLTVCCPTLCVSLN